MEHYADEAKSFESIFWPTYERAWMFFYDELGKVQKNISWLNSEIYEFKAKRGSGKRMEASEMYLDEIIAITERLAALKSRAVELRDLTRMEVTAAEVLTKRDTEETK